MKTNEDIYKKLAETYMDSLGSELMAEHEDIKNTPIPVERTDYLVQKGIKQPAKSNISRIFNAKWAAGIAAALVILIAIPFVYQTITNYPQTSDINQEEEAASEGIPSAELLPLSFNLPSNLSVTDSKLDNGVSIYYLADKFLDDIVLQMQPAGNADLDTSSLQQIEINGKHAYAGSFSDYNILEFEEDGISYSLTCKHDINTLISLSKNIL